MTGTSRLFRGVKMDTYKSDWQEARERLCAWWNNEPLDRAVAVVESPRRGVEPKSTITNTPDMYTDPDTVSHNLDARLESTFFGGEAFPRHWVYLGPVPLSICMGCEPHFEESTVWHSRLYDDWESAVDVRFDPSNRWCRLLKDLTTASLERSKGRYLVSGQGFGCALDVIADMWGSEETLMAMAERPDTVKEVVEKLVETSKTLYDQFDAITSSRQEGSFDWISLWAPGRMWTIQSDLCCTISPAMFEDFVLEELRQEAEHADYAFYHLDGPDAIRHLDAILSIEALDGIQWVPGAGASSDPLDWIDLFLRIQEAGKKIQIYCQPNRVTDLLKKVSPRNVCLRVLCPDQDSAEQVLRELERIGA